MLLDKKILAIDYGTKNVGLAFSYEFDQIYPYANLANNNRLIDEILQILKIEKIQLILLGFPKLENLNSYNSIQTKIIAFYELLKQKTPIEIVLVNEMYSTKDAKNELLNIQTNKKAIKKNLDANAACYLIKNYLAELIHKKNKLT